MSFPLLQRGQKRKHESNYDDDDDTVKERKNGLFIFEDKPANQGGLVDIVAVHGLGGHAYDTWSDKNQKIWLRDFLPSQVSNARIMSYGYDSIVAFSKGVGEVEDFATDLLVRLNDERGGSEEKVRPIIFICHSLGGIVVKSAIIYAHNHSSHYKTLLDQVRGIVFIGTPHRGSDVAYWAGFLARALHALQFSTSTNNSLLPTLERNSKQLSDVSQQFIERGTGLQIRTFYEKEKLPYMSCLIVDKDSAVLNLPNEIPSPIQADHRTMCKFSSIDDQKYRPMWKAIKSLVDNSTVNLVSSQSTSQLHRNRESSLTEEEAEKCISSLFLADYASKLDEIPVREPGTCEWVLNHQNLREWMDARGPSLLWISGNPGSGKTVISSFLVESFRKRSNMVIYFTCDNKHEHFRERESILRSLLHQIFVLNPSAIRHAAPHYKCMKESMVTSAVTLWKIFEAVMRNSTITTVYCALDALDECEDQSRRWLLEKLSRFFSVSADVDGTGLIGAGSLKMIVTSRPWEDIVFGLSRASRIRLKTEDNENISHDIITFVKAEVRALVILRGYSTSLRDLVSNTIVEKAGGMFLWVSIVVDGLRRTPVSDVHRRLQALPKTLFDLYSDILAKIDDGAVTQVKHILTWIVTALRPLKLEELAIACQLRQGQTQEFGQFTIADLVEGVKGDIGLCGPILTIRDGHVNLVHQSAKDFFLAAQCPEVLIGSPSRYYINITQAHTQLAILCVTYLSLDDFDRDPLPIRCLDGSGGKLFDNHLAQFPFLKYAAEHWPEHFRMSGEPSQSLSELVCGFLDLRSNANAWFQTFFFLNEDPFSEWPSGGSPLHFASYIGSTLLIELLVKHGAELDAEDDDGLSSLHWLTILPQPANRGLSDNQRDSVARLLIEVGVDVEAKGGRHQGTALHYSVRYIKAQLTKLLLEKGARLNALDRRNQTPLHWAMGYDGIGETIDLLLDAGADVDAMDAGGHTPLHVAIYSLFDINLEPLLKAGVDPNGINNNGKAPLHMVADSGARPHGARDAKLLLDYGAHIMAKCNKRGWTALHWAAASGLADVAEILLERGADIGSALCHAAEGGHIKVARLLLENGAGKNFQTENRETLLHSAARNGHEAMVQFIQELDELGPASNDWLSMAQIYNAVKNGQEAEVQLLLESNTVDLNSKDSSGMSLLEVASGKAHLAVVQQLLDGGADVNAGFPLYAAAFYGHDAILKLLIERGANMQFQDGKIALASAARRGHPECVKLLLENGGDREARNNAGKTPLDLAKSGLTGCPSGQRQRRQEVVNLLKG